jgi:integrase
LFSGLAAGKPRTAHSLLRSNGRGWANPCSNALPAARIAARIDPPISFHGLRHTCAIRLAMKGVPLADIAAQLGHSDTRMVEEHYGHLAPSYVADTVRAAFGLLGIVEATNV